jgi:hypothetical protein
MHRPISIVRLKAAPTIGPSSAAAPEQISEKIR